jgi:hypothetical protein
MQLFCGVVGHFAKYSGWFKFVTFKLNETAEICVLIKYMYCYFMHKYVCQSEKIITFKKSELQFGC